MVNELRQDRSGDDGMQEDALQELGGDIEKAVEVFRKKGVKTSLTEARR